MIGSQIKKNEQAKLKTISLNPTKFMPVRSHIIMTTHE